MKKTLITLLSATILMASQAAYSAGDAAAGDAAAGKAKAAVCAACHGANGVATMPAYPNLAGQNEAYLVSALKAYRSKERNGGMAALMQAQAAALTDADIDNLAAYFAGL